MISNEYNYKNLRLVENNPEISQRLLDRAFDISLGKTNYCLKAPKEKDVLKASNFYNSNNKKVNFYKLTLKRFIEKAYVTMLIFRKKMQEHQSIQLEIVAFSKKVLHNDRLRSGSTN